MKKNTAIVYIITTLSLLSLIGIGFTPTVLATGKSVYGTLYMDDEIADPGVTVTLKLNDGTIVDQTTTTIWNDDNFIFGFDSSYEGKVVYFFVGDKNLVPDDNPSAYIDSQIGLRIDLHVTTEESDDSPLDDGSDDSSSGGTSSGGSPPPMIPTDDNSAPIAIAGGPYESTTLKEVIFDGTQSSDPDDDLLSYTWDFGDGSTGSGAIVSHLYAEGSYSAVLTVSDGSLSDDDIAEVTIIVGNHPPEDLVISGDKSVPVHEILEISVVAKDLDNDLIRYVIDWGDGSEDTVSSFIGSETVLDVTHSYTPYGLYMIQVYAEDTKGATSNIEVFEVEVDVKVLEDSAIDGFLYDDDGDGLYDGYMDHETGEKSSFQVQDDGTLGFDTDGDNEIDHIYDPDTDTIIEKQGFFSVNANTIGLILLFFVALTLIVLFILRKRRKVKKNTKIL